jgi:hypothetical protein
MGVQRHQQEPNSSAEIDDMRDSWQRGLWMLLLMALCASLGCGGAKESTTRKGDGTGEAGTPTETQSTDIHKTYDVADLPSVEEKLPPADQGRIIITLPTGWKTLQRNPKFLVACIPEDSTATKLPRITVAVSEAPADLTSNTTPDNAAEQAKLMQAQLVKDQKKWVETCKPLGLGDHTWIRHVRSAKLKEDYSAIQSLQTVRGGRLYTVELTVNAKESPSSKGPPILYAKAMDEYKKFAYAVAAHMTFPKDDGSATPPAESTPPAEEKPAEPKPEVAKSDAAKKE